MYSRADVVDEAGQGELRGSGAAAYSVFGFKDGDGASVSRQLHGGGQTVRSGSNDDRVIHNATSPSAHAPDPSCHHSHKTCVISRPGELAGDACSERLLYRLSRRPERLLVSGGRVSGVQESCSRSLSFSTTRRLSSFSPGSLDSSSREEECPFGSSGMWGVMSGSGSAASFALFGTCFGLFSLGMCLSPSHKVASSEGALFLDEPFVPRAPLYPSHSLNYPARKAVKPAGLAFRARGWRPPSLLCETLNNL